MAAKWKRSDGIVWEQLDGEALLVRPKSGERWTLNAAAARVWKLCDGTRGVRALAQACAQESGAGFQRAQAEIAALCERFAALGLLSGGTTQMENVALLSPVAPGITVLGLGGSPRRRPSPRGNSGPG